MYVIIYKASAKAKWVALPTLYKSKDEAEKCAEAITRDVINCKAVVRYIDLVDSDSV